MHDCSSYCHRYGDLPPSHLAHLGCFQWGVGVSMDIDGLTHVHSPGDTPSITDCPISSLDRLALAPFCSWFLGSIAQPYPQALDVGPDPMDEVRVVRRILPFWLCAWLCDLCQPTSANIMVSADVRLIEVLAHVCCLCGCA